MLERAERIEREKAEILERERGKAAAEKELREQQARDRAGREKVERERAIKAAAALKVGGFLISVLGFVPSTVLS